MYPIELETLNIEYTTITKLLLQAIKKPKIYIGYSSVNCLSLRGSFQKKYEEFINKTPQLTTVSGTYPLLYTLTLLNLHMGVVIFYRRGVDSSTRVIVGPLSDIEDMLTTWE